MLRRFLAIATGLLALLVAARGVMVLTMPGGWGWISNSFLQLWSSAAFYLLMLLNGFGYLLLAREQVQQELERLAVVDALTDVPNRRGFFIALAPWLALARRPGVPTALVLFDLDQFKRVNDSYGHPAGDTVLRAVVDVCKQQLRDSDQLGRMVGVEFAILLPRTGLAEAVLVAERMRAAIAASPVKSERAMIAHDRQLRRDHHPRRRQHRQPVQARRRSAAGGQGGRPQPGRRGGSRGHARAVAGSGARHQRVMQQRYCGTIFSAGAVMTMIEEEAGMYAAVDLGSNSFRLHIGKHDGEAIRVVKSMREPIRLGAGIDAKRQPDRGGDAGGAGLPAQFPRHAGRLPARRRARGRHRRPARWRTTPPPSCRPPNRPSAIRSRSSPAKRRAA